MDCWLQKYEKISIIARKSFKNFPDWKKDLTFAVCQEVARKLLQLAFRSMTYSTT